ncbi:KH domain-containing protein HEN4-like [Salvia miltiorrhiza]|uniref:KH domain-containing protein HEN4-like n=1 Tax=Salvia miltiorrhiza TaxID=226208 RepID=UPI0025AD62A5|nr:KH domain-containing protein HEN4-like [Salvia miltiorrhiza]
MEETTPFPSQKIPKSGPKQPPTNHRSSANPKQSHPDAPAAGQVAYRLLCHVHTAGGVIGNSGSIIKQLETLTGSRIRFEEGLPNCHERVVNIVGDAALVRKISVGGGEEENTVSVSKAQEGLMRVFERVLEVEGNTGKNDNGDDNEHRSNGLIVCRLLAPTVQIGALMGKGGKIVDAIRKSTGAKIRVFKKEQIPSCAAPEEELIQIVGGVLAVKKALVAVSRRLQDRTLSEGAPGHISTHGASQNSHSDFSLKNNTCTLSISDTAVEHCSVDHSSSADVEKFLNLDDKTSLKKVIFRFLCSSGIAGGVIGKGANIVKSLEKETGASIKFASPMSGSKERVAIISSLENPNPLYSPAQIAIVRVFARCVEVALDQGVILSLGRGESVSARILVASSQLSSILDGDGRLASDISLASGAEIQLTGADLPDSAGVDDNVVQVSGDYENVKSALFQLAGRLRENFFSGMGYKGAGSKHSSYSAISSSSPTGGEAAFSTQSAQMSRLSCIDELDHLGFVHKSNTSWLPGLQWEQANSIENRPRPVDGCKGLATFPSGFKHESNVGNEGSKQKVEVVVPREKFGSVYGENGSNLSRLREISSASVTVIDPSPGEGSGKVVISGTPECIRIAQTLLQAFISF